MLKGQNGCTFMMCSQFPTHIHAKALHAHQYLTNIKFGFYSSHFIFILKAALPNKTRKDGDCIWICCSDGMRIIISFWEKLNTQERYIFGALRINSTFMLVFCLNWVLLPPMVDYMLMMILTWATELIWGVPSLYFNSYPLSVDPKICVSKPKWSGTWQAPLCCSLCYSNRHE